jgi:NAD(P)-dependent dehydrogenase (short-subunit alcohol dehydrogenase family)
VGSITVSCPAAPDDGPSGAVITGAGRGLGKALAGMLADRGYAVYVTDVDLAAAKAGLRTEFPPLRALDASPGNLRPQTTSFIGRESEVAEVKAAVGAHGWSR